METPPFVVDPQAPVIKIGWKEKYAGILVLIVGIVYLIWQVSDFMSSRSNAYSLKEGAFSVNASELTNHVRSIISIILALVGGLLLLKGKRAGWVIGVALLVLLNIVAAGIMIGGYASADKLSKIAGGAVVFFLLLALVFLLLPSARIKYKAGRNALVTTVALIILLVGLYFFLQ